MKARAWWSVFALSIPIMVQANELAVIYDGGNTEPIAPYFEVFKDQDESADEATAPAQTLGAGDINQLLPIRSPGLSPGPLARQEIDRPFTEPLFMIGADPLSEHWLLTHRARLKRIGAVGLLVEVPDVAAFERLIDLADGLTLLPASGSDLAESLGIKRYPVLITQDSIAQ